MNKNKKISTRRLIPVSKWPQFHPWPSVGGLRHLIANKDSNGFDKVIKRIGSKLILIDENQFFKWVDEQN